MSTEMRKTGVDVVGDMPWGTHFCLFYETRADLLETLVSYCKAGLESQEFCLWVVAEPLAVDEATCALKQAVPDFDRYLADESIEIVAAHDILRLKGFLHVPGKDFRQVVQGVGARLQHYFDRPWGPGEPRQSRLVVIGRKGLDRAAIAAAIEA